MGLLYYAERRELLGQADEQSISTNESAPASCLTITQSQKYIDLIEVLAN